MPVHSKYGYWEEGWKTIPQYPKYEVNHYSHIRHRKHKRLLKPDSDQRVVLYDENAERHRIHVYHATLLAFFPHIERQETVDHIIEGDRSNNHVDNLQWLTRPKNSQKSNQEQPRRNPVNRAKIIEQWSCDGLILLATFPSCRAAQRETKTDVKNMIQCANNQIQQAGGYQWKWKAVLSDLDLDGEVWSSSEKLKEMLRSCRSTKTGFLSEASVQKIMISNMGRIKTVHGIKRFGRKDRKYRSFYKYYVHQLVWATFSDQIIQDHEVICHDDSVALDADGCYSNALCHLRIDSQSNNMKECYAIGSKSPLKKQSHLAVSSNN